MANKSKAAAPAAGKKDVKILMLHGYTQSGESFHAKTRALEKMLQKSLGPFGLNPILLYPTAPIRLQPKDIPGYEPVEADSGANEDAGGGKNGAATELDSWAWWRWDAATGHYLFINEGMSSLASTITEADGVDGVVGFSQGGGAAAMVAAALEPADVRKRPAPSDDATTWAWVDAIRRANKEQPLKFAVVYSGFVAQPAEFNWLYEPQIKTPSLHFIGGLDTVVVESRCRALADRCEGSQVLVHPGGHYIPVKKEWAMPLIGFIKQHSEEKPDSSPDSGSDAKI